jgi:hypothetical protein
MKSTNHVFRDVHLPKLSKDKCTQFIQALSVSEGRITSHFQLKNGFSDKDVMRREMFFRIQFNDLESVEMFESLGIKTTVPEVIGVDPLVSMDRE